MSNSSVAKAYATRLAFKKSILARISLTQAEIDALEKQRNFVQCLDEEAHSDLAMIDNHLASFKEIMDERGLTDDISYHHAVYADELVALTVADMQLRQIISDRTLSIRERKPADSVVSDTGDFDSSSSEGDSGGSASLASSGEDDEE